MFSFVTLQIGYLLAQATGADEPDGMSWHTFLPVVAIGLLFYFMLLRPERRRKAQMSSLMDNLKKNDRVVTIGGIHGTVVSVQQGSSDVVIKVDENSNTRLRVLRSAIARVVTDESEKKSDNETS
jgi:preprotein translocase subunit YajC